MRPSTVGSACIRNATGSGMSAVARALRTRADSSLPLLFIPLGSSVMSIVDLACGSLELVHARACVAVGVDREAAPAAVGTPGGDDPVGVVAEGGRLATCDVEPDVSVVALLGLALL